MRMMVISLAGFLACGGAAMACPNYALSSGGLPLDGAQIQSPMSFSVTAGGNNRLSDCTLGILGTGQVRSAPDFTFNMSNMVGRELELYVTSDCDPSLLVNTATAEWRYNDDRDGLNPGMILSNPADVDGRVDVWVGTFGGGSCPATLNVRSIGGPPPPAPAPAPTPVACPNPSLIGPSLTLTGAQLIAPQSYVAQATPGARVADCPGVDGFGRASEAPQFTLFLSQMGTFNFSAEVMSTCDPTLLMRDSTGTWHYDDDGAGSLQPLLEVPGANLNGRVDIWVGTFGETGCEGTISFQTIAAAPPPPPPAPVAGCPNPALQGAPVYTNGSELYSPDTFQVQAGGPANLATCGGIPGHGHYSFAPNYTFFLSGMHEYGRLEIEGSSSCDTTLLVRTADGQWFFDDDSNGNLDPLLNLRNTHALNGRLDIWVGTYSSGVVCPASIELETWLN